MNASSLSEFLASSKYIDATHVDIVECATNIASESSDTFELIDNCFQFVRDQIKHSLDFELNPVTVIASDVLRHGTGYCYAKSHLLAALLRANQIPAGLCYQRLSIDGEAAPFCLHGLNAVYITPYGWIRLDPRGNKQGVDAQFKPPAEILAFPIAVEGEADVPFIYAEPLTLVIECLESFQTFDQVAAGLPDLDPANFPEPDPYAHWNKNNGA